MKKRPYYIFIVYVFLCLLSCTEQHSDNSLPTILIDPDKVEDHIDISFLVEDDFEMIKLETANENLISEVEKVIYKYDHFFILDKTSRNLYSFTNEGKYICKIGERGSGPEEYSLLEDVYVENECVYLLDELGDVLVFDLNGHYKQRISFPANFYADEFIVNENGMFFVSNYRGSDAGDYRFYHYNSRTGALSKHLPFDENDSAWGGDHISEYNDEKLIIYSIDNKVYQLKDTILTPQYQIKFSSREVPEELKTEDAVIILKTSMKKKYLWGVSYLLNLGEYLLARYTDGNASRYVVIDRNSLSSSVANWLVMGNLGELYATDISQKDDMLFIVQDAHMFKDACELIYSKNVFKYEKDKLRFQKLADELTGDENPILFKFKLKE